MKIEMKEIMCQAHQMTKEIKAESPTVDYMFQLSLCIKFLIEEYKMMFAEVREELIEELVEELEVNPFVSVIEIEMIKSKLNLRSYNKEQLQKVRNTVVRYTSIKKAPYRVKGNWEMFDKYSNAMSKAVCVIDEMIFNYKEPINIEADMILEELTDKEIEFLNGMRTNCFSDLLEGFETWGTASAEWLFGVVDECSFNERQARGVLSSLVKKDLVHAHKDGSDHLVGFTQRGADLFLMNNRELLKR